MKPKLVINIEHIVCIATYEWNWDSEKYTDFMLVWWYQYDTMAYDILIADWTTYLSEYIKNI